MSTLVARVPPRSDSDSVPGSVTFQWHALLQDCTSWRPIRTALVESPRSEMRIAPPRVEFFGSIRYGKELRLHKLDHHVIEDGTKPLEHQEVPEVSDLRPDI